MTADEGRARLRAAVERARAGNASAFREVVEATHETVFRLATALAGDRDEAADVTQEAYIRAWERIEELRDAEAATGWLCRIARNVAHDRRRGWWSRVRAPLEAAAREPAPPDPPDAALEAAQTAGEVRAAMRTLPEKQRVVLALREIEGMSYEDIAVALGLPLGTVESRLHRARAALARRLARPGKEDA